VSPAIINARPDRTEVLTYAGKETINGRDVFKYTIQNGNYKIAEYILADGRLNVLVTEEKAFLFWNQINGGGAFTTTTYYSSYEKPVYAVSNGNMLVWEEISFDSDKGTSTEIIKGKQVNLLSTIGIDQSNELSVNTYDRYGRRIASEETTSTSLLTILLFIAPVLIILSSLIGRKKLNSALSKLGRKGKKEDSKVKQPVYGKDDIEKSMIRLQKNVLGSQEIKASFAKYNFAYIAKDGTNISGMFQDSLFTIYIMALKQWQNNNQGKDVVTSNDKELTDLDEYMTSAFLYAAKLFRQGGGKKCRHKDIFGEGDPYIWGKLGLYYKYWSDKLRDAMSENRSDDVNKILAGIGVEEKRFNSGSEENYWANKKKKPTIKNKVKLWFRPDHQPADGSFYSFLKTFGFEYAKLAVGLNEDKQETSAKPTSKWGRWLRNFMRITGFGMRSVNPFVIKYAENLKYLPLLLGIGFMYGQGGAALGFASIPLIGSVFVPLFVALCVINIAWEWTRMKKNSYLKPAYLRIVLGAVWIGAFIILLGLPALNIGAFFIKLTLLGLSFMEILGIFFWRHSPLGISFYQLFRSVPTKPRTRATAMLILHESLFIAISALISYFIFPWFFEHFAVSIMDAGIIPLLKLVGAFLFILNSLYITKYGTWMVTVFLSSALKPTRGPELDKDIKTIIEKLRKNKPLSDLEKKLLKDRLQGKLLNINYVGIPIYPFFNNKKAMDSLNFLLKENDQWITLLLKTLRDKFKQDFQDKTDEEMLSVIGLWLNDLYGLERNAGIPIWSFRQVTDDSLGELYVGDKVKGLLKEKKEFKDISEDELQEAVELEKEKLSFAFTARWFTDSWNKTDFSYNTGIYLVNLVEEIHALGIDEHFFIALTDNKFDKHDIPPRPELIYKIYKEFREGKETIGNLVTKDYPKDIVEDFILINEEFADENKWDRILKEKYPNNTKEYIEERKKILQGIKYTKNGRRRSAKIRNFRSTYI
jgi:hypothetical protein